MAKEIDRLGEVLSGLKGTTGRPASCVDELESLRLLIMQMTTTLALHEVQIAKLREAIILLGGTRSGA